MLIWNPQRSAKYTLPSKNSVMAELPALTISLRNYLNMPLSQRVTFFTPCFSVCGKKVKYPLPGKMEQSYHCTRAKGPDRRVPATGRSHCYLYRGRYSPTFCSPGSSQSCTPIADHNNPASQHPAVQLMQFLH